MSNPNQTVAIVIQGLELELAEKDKRIAELEAKVKELESRLADLKRRHRDVSIELSEARNRIEEADYNGN